MAVGTATKRRVTPDVDTKAEPKPTVNKQLVDLVTKWEAAEKKSGTSFRDICEFVAENDISRKELKQAFVDGRGMADLTANNEVSKVFKIINIPEIYEPLLAGEMFAIEAKKRVGKYDVTWKDGKTKTEASRVELKDTGEPDKETKFDNLMIKVALFAIEVVELEQADFVASAKAAYREQYAKLAAKEDNKSKQSGNGEGQEEDQDQDEDQTE